MRKRSLVWAVGITLSLVLASCGGDGANSNVASTSSLYSVNMKAALIYKYGGAQPAARVTFYLLDDSLQTILLSGSTKDLFKNRDWSWGYGHDMITEGFEGNRQVLNSVIKPHVVQTATTDFDGSAKFVGLRAGTYYLAGVAETRGGYAVWNVPVHVGGTQPTVDVILDQQNAAYAE